jgi:hypothetical protein
MKHSPTVPVGSYSSDHAGGQIDASVRTSSRPTRSDYVGQRTSSAQKEAPRDCGSLCSHAGLRGESPSQFSNQSNQAINQHT